MTLTSNNHGLTPGFNALRQIAHRYAQAAREVVAETIWPTRCVICDMPGYTLCPYCRARLPFLDWWRACPRCGAPYGCIQCTECNATIMQTLDRIEPPFDSCASAVIYQDSTVRIVRTWKDAGERRVVQDMAEFMALVAPPVWLTGSPTVVPIPVTTTAIRRRGFDHGNDLAEAVAERLGISNAMLFARPRTNDQRALTRRDRINNLRGRLQVLPNAVVPSSVLLVDDVYTTGSTLFAASDALRNCGVQHIFCLTFARVL